MDFEPVILVIHLLLALGIIGLVLMQRSEGGGLGIGGGGGGAGNFASPRGTANFLTKATGICAGLFFCTSLLLGILAGQHHQERSVLDALETDTSIENTLDTNADVSSTEETSDEISPDSDNLPAAPIAE